MHRWQQCGIGDIKTSPSYHVGEHFQISYGQHLRLQHPILWPFVNVVPISNITMHLIKLAAVDTLQLPDVKCLTYHRKGNRFENNLWYFVNKEIDNEFIVIDSIFSSLNFVPSPYIAAVICSWICMAEICSSFTVNPWLTVGWECQSEI